MKNFAIGQFTDEPIFTLTFYNEGTYVRSITFDYGNILNVIEEFKHLEPRIVEPLEKLYKKYLETSDPESRYQVLNDFLVNTNNEAPKTAINGASNIQPRTI